MISRELHAEIVRLHQAEGWPVGTIARQLRVHHDSVRRVIAQAGLPVPKTPPEPTLDRHCAQLELFEDLEPF